MNLRFLGLVFGLFATVVIAAAAAARYLTPAPGGIALVLAGVVSMALLFLLMADLRKLFFLIFIFRAACDPLFDSMKSNAGAASMGAGAALNGLIILIALLCMLRLPRTVARPVILMWAAFLTAALVSVPIAPEFFNALRLFLVQLSYCAAFAIPFYLIRSHADVQTGIRALLCSSLLPVLYALAELALGAGSIARDGLRIQSTFSHPNIFAFYLVLVISIILYVQKAPTTLVAQPMRWKLWLYMALLLALLVATKTRSAWAGCLFIFAIYGFFFQRRFLVYALLVPLLLLLDPGVRERLLDLTANNDYADRANLNSYAWRRLLWQSGLNWMQAPHQLFGYGLDSFKFYSPRFFPLEGQDAWDPHNVYVQLFFETGVAGLIGYAWMFFRLLKELARGAAEDKAGTTILLSIVLAYLVMSYFDNMLYYLSFNWYFWFFMGMACRALAMRRSQVRERRLAQTDFLAGPTL